MTENGPRGLLYTALAVVALVAQGCGKKPDLQPAAKAEAAVEEFLEGWTRGETPDKFADTHPRISTTDPDWKAGYRLLSFLSVESSQSQEGSPHFLCRFSLSLRDRKGKTMEKTVVYQVVPGEKYVINRAQR